MQTLGSLVHIMSYEYPLVWWLVNIKRYIKQLKADSPLWSMWRTKIELKVLTIGLHQAHKLTVST